MTANERTASERRARTLDLDVAILERGPREGEPVILVHGFPDDAGTWDRLAPVLAENGYRTIAPFVRGFGSTRIHDGLERTGEIGALARDVLELADALDLGAFHLVGHDWGARAGYAAAVLAPRRITSLTALAVAYGTNHAGQSMSIEQTRAYWYQWYFTTPRGAHELETNRRAFCRALWGAWSPGWRFEDDEFNAAADSFENPDFVVVALSSYRQRWGFVPGAVRYAADRERLEQTPPIAVPTQTLLGADDGATLAASAAGKEALFTGAYRVEVIGGSGHFLQRERPDVVADRVLAHLREHRRSDPRRKDAPPR
ncbi:MAG TPA: alpha/beta hydrolase [Candidatus Acidoferrum sp.]|nr:alpha/beta hydrolase [Candidatus Acidoferrum sp.]